MDTIMASELWRNLTPASIALRMALALCIGGLLGMERGRRNRPAGFRTYMLVCLGAALVMMTNQYVFQYFGASDPVRMGAQVVSGIGFLGAGTIIITGRSQIRGITTAAGLWAAACCGLAIGIGFYEGAVIGGLAVFVIMAVFQRLDARIRANAKSIEIYVELDPQSHFGDFIAYAQQQEVDISDIEMQKHAISENASLNVIAMATSRRKAPHSQIIQQLGQAPGVLYIEELH